MSEMYHPFRHIQGVKKFRIQTLRVCRGDKRKPFCYVTNIWQVLSFLARGPWSVWRRMVLQKLLKNRPFTLMYSWYLRANDCVSRIIAAASATRATSSSGGSIDISYTKHFISPKIKKSIGVRSEERGGHCTGSPLPIQRLGKTLFRYSLTSRTKCAGAPLCWNHNRCLTCSGTFSNISGNMSRIKIM